MIYSMLMNKSIDSIAGCSLQDSVKFAKDYITGALKQGLDLGQGNGPLDHTYIIK